MRRVEMSRLVREWLELMNLLPLTIHEDRVEIDREIERRTGVYCDDALSSGLVSKREFEALVREVLKRRRRRREEAIIV